MGRNTLKLDTSGFDSMIDRLKRLDGDVQKAVTDALEQAGETITEDTRDAVTASNLPAGGQYSTGATAESIVDPKIVWVGGTQAESCWSPGSSTLPLGWEAPTTNTGPGGSAGGTPGPSV